jgi:hypothetical protein
MECEMYREVFTPWLERRRLQVCGDRRGRQVIRPAWFQRPDLDRWLAHDGIKRIADDLRERRSAASGERRNSDLLP